MDRYWLYHSGPWEGGDPSSRYGPYLLSARPEPWSRRRVVTTWMVAAALTVAGLAALPALREHNERSWCSGGGGLVSEACLADQRAIRCGLFGIFHCPPGGD